MGVKSVCGVEIGGVTVIWAVSKLLPVRDCAGKPMVSTLIPGRLLHVRFQVQADNSEFDMLAAYMPAPSADEARRTEIKSCWAILRDTMLRLGSLVVLVGDLNAEPAEAGARRHKPALHRALGDGLLQGLMKERNLRWLGGQRPTYFQAVGSERGGARGADRAAAGAQRAPPRGERDGGRGVRRPRRRARVSGAPPGASGHGDRVPNRHCNRTTEPDSGQNAGDANCAGGNKPGEGLFPDNAIC